MSRISSQGSVLMISSDDVDAVSVVVSAATNAKPCVLTIAAGPPAPVVGDIIVPRNTGWKSLDDQPFKVSAVALGAVTLEDSDTTREVVALNTTGTPPASISLPTWLEMCRSNFNANNPAGATIDVTTLCDNAHRIVAGLPAIATWTAAGFWDCNDAALTQAREAYRSGDNKLIDVRLNDGCGWTFATIVNSFDITLGINAAVTNSLGGQINGQVHFYKTPSADFVPLAMTAAAPAPPRVAA